MTEREILTLLKSRMRDGSRIIFGGIGGSVDYYGIRHADGTEEYATPAMAETVRQIDSSAHLPVNQRRGAKRR